MEIDDNYKNFDECGEFFCEFSHQQQDKAGFEYDIKGSDMFNSKIQKTQSIELQTIHFEAIEFPWVFHGPSAISFIYYLVKNSQGSRLFSNKVVQNVILF